MGLVLIGVTFVLMWVLFVMPQQRRMRAHRELVAAIEVGDDVMTSAGIYGTVKTIEGDDVSLEIAPGVEVRMARGAVARRIRDEPTPDDSGSSRPSGTAADRANELDD